MKWTLTIIVYLEDKVNEMNFLVTVFTAIWWRVITKSLKGSELLQKAYLVGQGVHNLY